MIEQSTTVAVPRSWLSAMCLSGAVIGFLAAHIVKPVVNWIVEILGSAPSWLNAAANLPSAWAVPVLSLIGLAVGGWFASEWQKENGSVVISRQNVTVFRESGNQRVARERIASVYTDGKDLVIADRRTNELLRISSDNALEDQMRRAFELQGYPWKGTKDPNESSFETWIDGDDALDSQMHAVLRQRRGALEDKHFGAAKDFREELLSHGVIVRDRNGTQQVRVIPREYEVR